MMFSLLDLRRAQSSSTRLSSECKASGILAAALSGLKILSAEFVQAIVWQPKGGMLIAACRACSFIAHTWRDTGESPNVAWTSSPTSLHSFKTKIHYEA